VLENLIFVYNKSQKIQRNSKYKVFIKKSIHCNFPNSPQPFHIKILENAQYLMKTLYKSGLAIISELFSLLQNSFPS